MIKKIKDFDSMYINGIKRKYSLFICICGKIFKARTINSSKSCGCLKKTKNGLTTKYPKITSRYQRMISRCYNKKDKNYHLYGKLGITVCNEWLGQDGLKNYINWLINQDEYYNFNNLEIDKDIKSEQLKINPGIYSPETCMLVSRSINIRAGKKRINSTTNFIGVSKQKNGSFFSHLKTNKYIYLGTYDTKEKAAMVRDYYIDTFNPGNRKNNINYNIDDYKNISIDGINIKKTSNYYGVSFYKNKNNWTGRIQINKIMNRLGYFNTEKEAALAVNDFLIKNNHNLHKLNKVEQ